MKIVDVAETFAPNGGGVRTYVMQKFAAAKRHGHDLSVIAPGPEDRTEPVTGGRIIWVKSPALPLDRRYRLFVRPGPVRQHLDAIDPDVIEVSSPQASAWFVAQHNTRARKVFVFHTDPLAVHVETFLGHRVGWERLNRCTMPYWRVMARLAQRFDATVVAGEWLRKRLDSHGLPRVVTVPFGIDKTCFSPTHREMATRQTLIARAGAPIDARLLVTVGRLVPEKRIKMLAKAFARAAQSRPLAWVILGGGPSESWLRREAQRTPGIHFMGHTRDRLQMAKVLASADGLLHGSAAETFGIAVAEALACGLPAVVPNRGGASALIPPVCGVQYEAGNVQACVDAIHAFLERDRNALRTSCRTQVAGIPSVATHFDGLFALYATLPAQGTVATTSDTQNPWAA